VDKPHAWIYVAVADPAGHVVIWAIGDLSVRSRVAAFAKVSTRVERDRQRISGEKPNPSERQCPRCRTDERSRWFSETGSVDVPK
jgi:hypothetical protein